MFGRFDALTWDGDPVAQVAGAPPAMALPAQAAPDAAPAVSIDAASASSGRAEGGGRPITVLTPVLPARRHLEATRVTAAALSAADTLDPEQDGHLASAFEGAEAGAPAPRHQSARAQSSLTLFEAQDGQVELVAQVQDLDAEETEQLRRRAAEILEEQGLALTSFTLNGAASARPFAPMIGEIDGPGTP